MVLKALSDSTEEGGIVLRASNNLLSSKGLSDGDPFFKPQADRTCSGNVTVMAAVSLAAAEAN